MQSLRDRLKEIRPGLWLKELKMLKGCAAKLRKKLAWRKRRLRPPAPIELRFNFLLSGYQMI